MSERIEVTVSLSQEEMEQLGEIAERETRTPELQAQYMLRTALKVDMRMNDASTIHIHISDPAGEGDHV